MEQTKKGKKDRQNKCERIGKVFEQSFRFSPFCYLRIVRSLFFHSAVSERSATMIIAMREEVFFSSQRKDTQGAKCHKTCGQGWPMSFQLFERCNLALCFVPLRFVWLTVSLTVTKYREEESTKTTN